MDRREFFRRSLGKATETVVKEADRRVAEKAAHWIRPPFAIAELDFLLACTRCNACIEACPHQVVFPLPSRLGAEVVKTPALDLLNKGCHLCSDWPCVTACDTGALKLPEQQAEQQPQPNKFAQLSIDTASCLPFLGPECGACASACTVPGALVFELEKPRIDQQLCVGCAMCREYCIQDPKAIILKSVHTD